MILLKYTLRSHHKVHDHSHTPKFQRRAPTHTLKTLASTFLTSRRFYLQIFVVYVMPLQHTRSHLDKCIPCSHERQDLIQHSASGQKGDGAASGSQRDCLLRSFPALGVEARWEARAHLCSSPHSPKQANQDRRRTQEDDRLCNCT